MRNPFRSGIAAAGVAAVVLAGSTALAYGDNDRDGDVDDRGHGKNDLAVVGLTTDGLKLVAFESDKPGKIRASATVSGLTGGDTKLIGIDYRVQNGALYGVGNNTSAAGIYTIDDRGQAALVGRLTVALNGASFGVDFNPAANALRIISNTGQNLRQSFVATPLAATANDATLTYPATPTAPAATGVGVNGAAYTNNDLDPSTATTLYDLDTTLDQIVVQSPANSGLLVATGKLGVDAAGDVGFDIYSKVRDGKTVSVIGLAVINGSLYGIDVITGAATPRGTIGTAVSDLAIPLNQL